jgi:hypothetical protein
MNCDYVDQLLPLYVGGDLEQGRSSLVASHLQSCTECALAADEYAGADRLLHEYEPPLFSDEVYSGIRRQVLDEIKQKSEAPSWSRVVSQFFAPLAQRRFGWITATVLLAMSATAFYFIANRTNQRAHLQKVADGSRTGEQSTPDSRAGSQSETKRSLSSKGSDSMAFKRSEFTGRKVANAGRRSRQREKAPIDVEQTGMSTSRKGFHSGVDVSQPSSAPASLRVEMQTSHPNIRIIWLSSQRPEARVRETSKGI